MRIRLARRLVADVVLDEPVERIRDTGSMLICSLALGVLLELLDSSDKVVDDGIISVVVGGSDDAV